MKTFEISYKDCSETVTADTVKKAVKQFLPERGALRLDNGMYTTDRGFSLYGEKDFPVDGRSKHIRAYFQTKSGAFAWYFVNIRRVS